MATRKLDRSETDFMRDYIQEGVDRGGRGVQKQKRRRELTEIVNCTIKQVAGAVAWKDKGQEKLVLEPLVLDEKPETSEQPSSPPSLPTNIETDYDNSGEDDYEEMDYDYETKRRWRNKLQEQIRATLPLLDSTGNRVLFFPGRNCYEVEIYRELGIPSNQLVGFIKSTDPKVLADFYRSAQKFGIDARIGDLERACQMDIGKFDIVSLDFPGQFCDKYHRICTKIPLNDRSIVIVNTMGKREKGKAHVLLGVAEKAAHPQKLLEGLETFGARPYSTDEERERVSQELTAFLKEPTEDVAHAREQHAHLLTVGSMGIHQTRNWVFEQEILNSHAMQIRATTDKDPIQSLRSCASLLGPLMGRNLTARLAEYSWNNDIAKIDSVSNLLSGGLFLDTVFNRPHVLALKKYQYVSDGRSHSPFNTDIAVLDIPKDFYATLRQSAYFLLQCFLSELKRSWQIGPWYETRFFIRTRKGWELPLGGKLSKNDLLVFASNDQTICQIPLKYLFSEAGKHFKRISQYPLEEREEQANVVREAIQ